jgi:glutamyl/glutaminyl-tRNA synthetase
MYAISRSKREQADVDVGRRTGVLPHNLCRYSAARKLGGTDGLPILSTESRYAT